MAYMDERGKIQGGKVQYHVERCLEAIRLIPLTVEWGVGGDMLDSMVYNHARQAARHAFNSRRSLRG